MTFSPKKTQGFHAWFFFFSVLMLTNGNFHTLNRSLHSRSKTVLHNIKRRRHTSLQKHRDLQNAKAIFTPSTQIRIVRSLRSHDKAMACQSPHECTHWINTSTCCGTTHVLDWKDTSFCRLEGWGQQGGGVPIHVYLCTGDDHFKHAFGRQLYQAERNTLQCDQWSRHFQEHPSSLSDSMKATPPY